MKRYNVKQHTRKTKSGRIVPIREHSRLMANLHKGLVVESREHPNFKWNQIQEITQDHLNENPNHYLGETSNDGDKQSEKNNKKYVSKTEALKMMGKGIAKIVE